MLHRSMTYCAHLLLVDGQRVVHECETHEGMRLWLGHYGSSRSIRYGVIFLGGIVVARWARAEERFVALPEDLGWD